MLWTRLSASETSVNTVCECACVCIHVFKWFFMLWTRFFLLRGLYICVCIYIYVCIYLCVYILYYIYVHIEKGFDLLTRLSAS